MKRLFIALITCCLTTTLVSCSNSPVSETPQEECEQAPIDLVLLASERLNRDKNGGARPARVRIYQLSSVHKFKRADFENIWLHGEETLGEDVVDVKEIDVFPGSRTQLSVERNEKARVLVVAALFRRPLGNSWYRVINLGGPACPEPCEGDDCVPVDTNHYFWFEQQKVGEGIHHADYHPDGREFVDSSTSEEE